jgi:L-lactate dehydrogenase complex protein LldG
MVGPPVTARDEVLDRVRSALSAAPPPTEAVSRTYRTSGEHPPGHPALLDLLADRIVDYRATVHRAEETELAGAIARALPAGARVVVPPGLPPAWVAAESIEVVVDDGLSAADLDTLDGVVTAAAVAIAETGTIVLDGSPDQGRRALSLVPDLHVCVVRSDQVVATVPEALPRLDPTRPLTWISGPSATSDIELDRVEGVHGPRTLHVILIHPT